MSTWSFAEAMEAAKTSLSQGKTKGGAIITDGTYKASDGKVRSTIGRRIEIAKYAAAHGTQKAATHFGVPAQNVSTWSRDFREGRYEGVPPDQCYVKYNAKSKTVTPPHEIELTRLSTENKQLREMIDKLIAARR